jgi:hypothetical protein
MYADLHSKELVELEKSKTSEKLENSRSHKEVQNKMSDRVCADYEEMDSSIRTMCRSGSGIERDKEWLLEQKLAISYYTSSDYHQAML